MCLGPKHPACTHSSNAWCAPTWPVSRFNHHPHRKWVPSNVRIRRIEVQVLRDAIMLEGEHDFDHASDAGGGRRITEIALDRTDEGRPFGATSLGKNGSDGLDLYRVAKQGA